uniref:Helix-turn-helix domain-containing protein n=1 Tax=Geladintestivirus 2 TaxID=3233134 RepID=A0AAU8MGP0_9CAUD
MNASKKFIASVFRKVANRIENDECEVDEEELVSIATSLIHVKLTAEQMCHYLKVSRATLSRMVIDGRVSHPRKTLGGDKYWWKDEVDMKILEYKQKYSLE